MQVLDFAAQVADRSVGLRVGVYGGALDSVDDCQHCNLALRGGMGDGLLDSGVYGGPLDKAHGSRLCGDPLRGGGTGGGLLGGSMQIVRDTRGGLLGGGRLRFALRWCLC